MRGWKWSRTKVDLAWHDLLPLAELPLPSPRIRFRPGSETFDGLAGLHLFDARERLAVLTAEDAGALKHVARSGMGKNPSQSLASDLGDLDAWARAAPWRRDRPNVAPCGRCRSRSEARGFATRRFAGATDDRLSVSHTTPDRRRRSLWRRQRGGSCVRCTKVPPRGLPPRRRRAAVPPPRPPAAAPVRG